VQEREATFHDSAWLSTVPSLSSLSLPLYKNGALSSPSFLEDDIELVQNALGANGLSLEDITSQAFGCLLESVRKFALELITDAVDYSMAIDDDDDDGGNDHSKDGGSVQGGDAESAMMMEEITPADLQLALEMQDDNQVNSGENLYHLTQIADEVNRSVLPPIPDYCYNGIVLPPPEYNLLGRTFDVVSRPRPSSSSRSGPNSIMQQSQTDATSKGQNTNGHGTLDTNKNSASNSSRGMIQQGDSLQNNSAIRPGNEHNQKSADSGINTAQSKKMEQKRSVPSYGAKKGQQIEIKYNNPI